MLETGTTATESRAARWHRRALRALDAGDLEAVDRACARTLGLDPDHADALFLRAACDLRRGYPAKALSGFERATALVADRADYWAQYAGCLVHLGRHAEALAAVDKATACPLPDAVTHDTLGKVLTVLGRHAQAAVQYEAAIGRAAANPELHYRHGTSLLFCGELDRAQAAFRRAIELDPVHVLSHLALAENFPANDPDARIARLQATLARVRGNADDELIMHHALARTLETAGRSAEAFAHFVTGKHARKIAVGYTIEEDKRIFAAAERLFPAGEEVRQQPAKGEATEAPIFVLGMARTGTTLVERILSSHSEVISGGELSSLGHSVWEAGGRLGRHINPDTWREALSEDPQLIGQRYRAHAAVTVGDAERFIDKRPLNYFLIGFIRRSLPNARIVCLRRGALDTCIANLRHFFSPHKVNYRYALTLEDIAEYFAMFERLMEHWHRVFPGAIHDVRYERLVTDFDGEVRSLLEYLGLPFEPSVASFHENQEPVATASAVQVRQPLYASSIGSWRRYATEMEPVRQRLLELGVDVRDRDPGVAVP